MMRLIDAKNNQPTPPLSRAIKNVQIVCDLYNLAFEMKSLELKRKHPDTSDQWIFDETIRLIELGCR